jgi:putative membrane protein
MHAFTLALLAGTALAYAIGARRRWGSAITPKHAACFGAGIAVLALAAYGPFERSLWSHMIQHELLMVVAAPLLALGRPLVAVTVRVPRWLHDPLLAWTLHAAAVIGWHIPAVFVAAAASEELHFVQHAFFLGTAIVFWWTTLALGARHGVAAIGALFTTMLYTGALGALMTLSRHSWYAGYALEDQQLAGLIMWIPAGLAYPAAALYLGSRWLRRAAA